MPSFAPGQTLLIDADDTLWENNIYFERAIASLRHIFPSTIAYAIQRKISAIAGSE